MKIIKVCAALIVKGGKILLTSRPGQFDHAGYWEFPGGKMEPGESSAQCIKRELKEELNVDIEVYDTVYMLEHEYPDKHVSLRFIRCAVKNGHEPQAMENQKFAWVEYGKINTYPLLPADKPVADFLMIFQH